MKEKLRHSTAHILASAVKELFPKAKLGIGPAIEEGFYYDFDFRPFNPEDLEKIEKKMQEIIDKHLPFKKEKKTRSEAEKLLKDEPYKLELLKDLKDNEITFYSHGDFTDLCVGPHIKNTSEIKAFKLIKTAGAYWRGNSKNKQLQRIYGTAFSDKKQLRTYLHQIQEAEKRDHRKIGKQLELFSIHEEGTGFPFWLPKGMILKEELINFWRQKHKEANYVEIQTPIILNKKLWETSGHWENYKENMYFTKIEGQEFAVKPMNCPGGILIYKEKMHSYKELPLRVAELGLVHRNELSGVLSGLFRVRAFTQDDAHIYCKEDQIEEELNNVINLVIDIYKTFGFRDYEFEVSTKPEKAVGTKKMWDKATESLKQVLTKRKIKYNIDEGEGVFYGPKIDIKVRDVLGRQWQCATIQYDFNLPERFNLTYEGEDGKKHRPYMIHRTIYGSLERFIGILIEHYAGKFPLWLAPTQAIILTVSDKNKKFAEEVYKRLKESSIRVELDERDESISKKVRDAQMMKIPRIITIGDKEQKNKTLAIRTLDGEVKFNVKIDSFIKETQKQIGEKK